MNSCQRNGQVFSIGDCIQFKTMKEMNAEFGKPLVIPCGWNTSMNYLCGQTAHISSIHAHGETYVIDTVEEIERMRSGSRRNWMISVEMIKLVEEDLPEVSEADYLRLLLGK